MNEILAKLCDDLATCVNESEEISTKAWDLATKQTLDSHAIARKLIPEITRIMTVEKRMDLNDFSLFLNPDYFEKIIEAIAGAVEESNAIISDALAWKEPVNEREFH